MPEPIFHDFSMKDKPFDPREQDVQLPDVAGDVEIDGQNICAGCGSRTRLHWSRITDKWVGCPGAVTQERQLPENPERWNDPYSLVTAAVRRAMVDGTCGPRYEIEMAGYTNDEQLTIAAVLVRVAITAYLKGLPK